MHFSGDVDVGLEQVGGAEVALGRRMAFPRAVGGGWERRRGAARTDDGGE